MESAIVPLFVVQWLSHLWLLATPSTRGFPLLHYLLEFAQTHVCWVSDAVQPSHPLPPPSPLPSISPSIRVFSNKLALHIRWPNYWSFNFNISPSNEHPGLISFRMNWLDLLVVQGLSRVFSNTTVQKHQFFCTQLSLQSNSHVHTWPLEKPYPWLDEPLLAK